MAFDPISGTVSVLCIIILTIVTFALYTHQNNYQKLTESQIYDIVDQINHAHLHHYALTKKQSEESASILKDLKAMKANATSPHFGKVYIGNDYELYQLNDQLRVTRQGGNNMSGALQIAGGVVADQICANDMCLGKEDIKRLKEQMVSRPIIMKSPAPMMRTI
jgi:hypothetical protein